jgi:hypothetical protein
VYINYLHSRRPIIQPEEKYCTILTMELVRLIKMCLNKTHSKVCTGRNLSDAFPNQNGLKQEDALTQLLFNCTLEYAIRKNWNSMEHISSWSMLVTLISWAKT